MRVLGGTKEHLRTKKTEALSLHFRKAIKPARMIDYLHATGYLTRNKTAAIFFQEYELILCVFRQFR